MTHGFERPLYLLPFDHRHSYLAGMFGFNLPLDAWQHSLVVDSKRLIFEGFRKAIADGVPVARAGVLVDEEFGADVLRDAKAMGAMTAVSVEGSGSDEFQFEYGDDFGAHLERIDPTFAKVLVRFNVDGDGALNARQTARLSKLSTWCTASSRKLMFELLVPPTAEQLKTAGGDAVAFDRHARAPLMTRAIEALQNAGVEPDVWKIEGLESRADCERIVGVARRGGRDAVSCIVLGRGAHDDKVAGWLETAASVTGFIGFAVGRTSFWDAVADFRKGKATREEAAARIAARFREWVDIFEKADADKKESGADAHPSRSSPR